MLIHDWLLTIASSQEAHHVKIDLCSKTLFLKSDLLVKEGVLVADSISMADGSTVHLTGIMAFDGDPYAEIETLYAHFKRSVPSNRDRLNKGNFKALSSDQLSYEELENNMRREEARLRLEGFILLAASAEVLTWKNPTHFFWQGTDPDLILYREWILKEEHL